MLVVKEGPCKVRKKIYMRGSHHIGKISASFAGLDWIGLVLYLRSLDVVVLLCFDLLPVVLKALRGRKRYWRRAGWLWPQRRGGTKRGHEEALVVVPRQQGVDRAVVRSTMGWCCDVANRGSNSKRGSCPNLDLAANCGFAIPCKAG